MNDGMREGILMRQEKMIGGRQCYFYGDAEASDILIQAIDEHDLELLDSEVALIGEGTKGKQFALAAFLIKDWNRELSPWEAPPVFGKEGFGAGAEETLRFIEGKLIPEILAMKDVGREAVAAEIIGTEMVGVSAMDSENLNSIRERLAMHGKRLYLGGYSLAGLFALWVAYQTDLFQGIAGVSPSVWFPGWDKYIKEHEIHAEKVYLSLGDKEEKARNRVMARVGAAIRLQHELLLDSAVCKECTMEWNPGNHFMDSDRRTAKGFAWLLNQVEISRKD